MRGACLIAFFCAASTFAGTLKDLDEKNGFRDAKFGMKFEEFKDMKIVEDGKDSKYYERTTDEKQIGKATLTEIVYGFWNDKLFMVAMTTDNVTDARALLEGLSSAYGEGKQKNRYMEDRTWLGAKVYMSYDENAVRKSAKVVLMSIEIADEKKNASAEAAKKAKDDL